MTRTPKVYVLCGFIGAGKTTFARQLEESTGAVRITKDEWLIRLVGTDPTIDRYDEINRRICDLTRDFAFTLAAKGIDVILDEGFWAREERAELTARIKAAGAEPVLYFIDTPVDVMRERIHERNDHLNGDSFHITPDLVDHYLQFWQPPEPDEGFIRVTQQ